jgi:hypothetical protein
MQAVWRYQRRLCSLQQGFHNVKTIHAQLCLRAGFFSVPGCRRLFIKNQVYPGKEGEKPGRHADLKPVKDFLLFSFFHDSHIILRSFFIGVRV